MPNIGTYPTQNISENGTYVLRIPWDIVSILTVTQSTQTSCESQSLQYILSQASI